MGSERLLPRLQIMFDGYLKVDPPNFSSPSMLILHSWGWVTWAQKVHCNLCNNCYTLGMPGPRPDIRCVQYLPKSTWEVPLVRSRPHQDQDFWILIKNHELTKISNLDHIMSSSRRLNLVQDQDFPVLSRSWLSSPARARSSKIKFIHFIFSIKISS